MQIRKVADLQNGGQIELANTYKKVKMDKICDCIKQEV